MASESPGLQKTLSQQLGLDDLLAADAGEHDLDFGGAGVMSDLIGIDELVKDLALLPREPPAPAATAGGGQRTEEKGGRKSNTQAQQVALQAVDDALLREFFQGSKIATGVSNEVALHAVGGLFPASADDSPASVDSGATQVDLAAELALGCVGTDLHDTAEQHHCMAGTASATAPAAGCTAADLSPLALPAWCSAGFSSPTSMHQQHFVVDGNTAMPAALPIGHHHQPRSPPKRPGRVRVGGAVSGSGSAGGSPSVRRKRLSSGSGDADGVALCSDFDSPSKRRAALHAATAGPLHRLASTSLASALVASAMDGYSSAASGGGSCNVSPSSINAAAIAAAARWPSLDGSGSSGGSGDWGEDVAAAALAAMPGAGGSPCRGGSPGRLASAAAAGGTGMTKEVVTKHKRLPPAEPMMLPTRRLSRGNCVDVGCHNCGKVANTPQMRRGPAGNATLCNACGSRLLKGTYMERTAEALPSYYPIDHSNRVVYWPGKATKHGEMLARLPVVHEAVRLVLHAGYRFQYNSPKCTGKAHENVRCFFRTHRMKLPSAEELTQPENRREEEEERGGCGEELTQQPYAAGSGGAAMAAAMTLAGQPPAQQQQQQRYYHLNCQQRDKRWGLPTT